MARRHARGGEEGRADGSATVASRACARGTRGYGDRLRLPALARRAPRRGSGWGGSSRATRPIPCIGRPAGDPTTSRAGRSGAGRRARRSSAARIGRWPGRLHDRQQARSRPGPPRRRGPRPTARPAHVVQPARQAVLFRGSCRRRRSGARGAARDIKAGENRASRRRGHNLRRRDGPRRREARVSHDSFSRMTRAAHVPRAPTHHRPNPRRVRGVRVGRQSRPSRVVSARPVRRREAQRTQRATSNTFAAFEPGSFGEHPPRPRLRSARVNPVFTTVRRPSGWRDPLSGHGLLIDHSPADCLSSSGPHRSGGLRGPRLPAGGTCGRNSSNPRPRATLPSPGDSRSVRPLAMARAPAAARPLPVHW